MSRVTDKIGEEILFCGAGGIVLLVLAIFPLLCIWTDRNLDWLCSHIAHHAVNVPWWLSSIAALFCSPLAIPFNIGVEIMRVCV